MTSPEQSEPLEDISAMRNALTRLNSYYECITIEGKFERAAAVSGLSVEQVHNLSVRNLIFGTQELNLQYENGEEMYEVIHSHTIVESYMTNYLRIRYADFPWIAIKGRNWTFKDNLAVFRHTKTNDRCHVLLCNALSNVANVRNNFAHEIGYQLKDTDIVQVKEFFRKQKDVYEQYRLHTPLLNFVTFCRTASLHFFLLAYEMGVHNHPHLNGIEDQLFIHPAERERPPDNLDEME